MKIIRSLLRVWRPASWKALYRDLTYWSSPLRVLRCFFIRITHPRACFQRWRLGKTQLAKEKGQHTRFALMHKEGSASAQPDLDPKLTKEVCTVLRKKADEVTIDVNAETSGKNFWKHLLESEKLDTDSPFVKLALSPAVLDMACNYFGEVPYLAYIQVAYSHPTNNDSWKASQLWHEDYDDQKLCKLFVYCTDVEDEESGPFTYVPKDLSKNVSNTFIPGRIEDDVMSKYIDLKKDVRSVMGPAETAFYIDTRNCYHLGSRVAEGHGRIAFMAAFVSFASLNPFDNGIEITRKLSPIEKLVLRK